MLALASTKTQKSMKKLIAMMAVVILASTSLVYACINTSGVYERNSCAVNEAQTGCDGSCLRITMTGCLTGGNIIGGICTTVKTPGTCNLVTVTAGYSCNNCTWGTPGAASLSVNNCI